MGWLPFRVLDLLLAVSGLPLLVASGYLSLLALLARREPAADAERAAESSLKFDVVVPAHDEEAGIAATIESLRRLDYPAHLYRVLVVADNCSDRTAEVARASGAVVLTRRSESERGKGYALRFAFERSAVDGFADAVAVVDADTVVSPNLLRAFAARLAGGAVAVQAHYTVRNPDTSWRTRLLAIAFALFHLLRSSGRERLGVSCGLRGNGMCFASSLLAELPHDAFSVVEDVEYGIRLGLAGHRVSFAAEARVEGEMAGAEAASRSQRLRWERGRRALAREHGARLLLRALRERSLLLLDLALDVLIPPLSTLVLASTAWTAASAALSLAAGHAAVSLWLSLACTAGLFGYVSKGWWLSRTGLAGLRDLAFAPAYVIWKLLLLLERSPGAPKDWVRTARENETR